MLALSLGLTGSWAAGALGQSSHHPLTCPKDHAGPASSRAAEGQTLVPGASNEVVLCRYRFSRLEGVRGLSGTHTIRRLSREYNALRRPPKGHTWACPADDGTTVVAQFKYPHGSPVTVRLEVTGCQLVTSGSQVRWANPPPGPRLTRQLLRLTGCPREGGGPACFTFR